MLEQRVHLGLKAGHSEWEREGPGIYEGGQARHGSVARGKATVEMMAEIQVRPPGRDAEPPLLAEEPDARLAATGAASEE